ncbi:MAG: hypothetical protein ACFWT2_00765 [Thermoanaerobacterium thermosaccharolyticum]|jgi:predicted acetyltransferase
MDLGRPHSRTELLFFINGEIIIDTITIRRKDAKSIDNDGYSGFGIRPSQRHKGYATKILSMALLLIG